MHRKNTKYVPTKSFAIPVIGINVFATEITVTGVYPVTVISVE